MKKLLLLSLILLPTAGCMNITKLAEQLKDDPAVVRINVTTLYGSGSLVRVGSNTNSVVIDPDNTIRVNGERR